MTAHLRLAESTSHRMETVIVVMVVNVRHRSHEGGGGEQNTIGGDTPYHM